MYTAFHPADGRTLALRELIIDVVQMRLERELPAKIEWRNS
jgi:hypothetical protein